MFTRLDTDDNGQLNFLEFLRLARNLFNVYELGEICRLRNIFKKYDHSSLDEVSSSSTADILSEFLVLCSFYPPYLSLSFPSHSRVLEALVFDSLNIKSDVFLECVYFREEIFPKI